MTPDKSQWYSIVLPRAPFPLTNVDFAMTDATSEEGLRLFAETHTKAYGERATEDVHALYRQDVEEGVVDRDKMITILQGSHPLGCMSYEVLEKPDGDKYVLIHNLGVDLDHRGRGFGEQIIKMVLNLLVDSFGAGTLVLADTRAVDGTAGEILDKIGFGRVEPEDWFPFAPHHGAPE